MYWNHRVFRSYDAQWDEESFWIGEVHYDENDHSILGWTEKTVPWSDSVDGLRQTLHWMLDALDKPVLDEDELTLAAQEARERGDDPIFPIEDAEFLTLDEVLDSLGLEREDIEGWENEGGAK